MSPEIFGQIPEELGHRPRRSADDRVVLCSGGEGADDRHQGTVE